MSSIKISRSKSPDGKYTWQDVYLGNDKYKSASVTFSDGRQPRIEILNRGLSIAEAERAMVALATAIALAKQQTPSDDATWITVS